MKGRSDDRFLLSRADRDRDGAGRVGLIHVDAEKRPVRRSRRRRATNPVRGQRRTVAGPPRSHRCKACERSIAATMMSAESAGPIVQIWSCTPSTICNCLVPEHDPEKWVPVFRKEHAQTTSLSVLIDVLAQASACSTKTRLFN